MGLAASYMLKLMFLGFLSFGADGINALILLLRLGPKPLDDG
jgi:hypothetical protein